MSPLPHLLALTAALPAIAPLVPQRSRPSPPPEAQTTVPKLAAPTGLFLVGTRIYHWIDEKREEPLTPEKGDKRELMVQVWYPTAKRVQDKPVPDAWSSPYIPGYETMQPLLSTQYGDAAPRFGRLRVPVQTDAPLIKSPRKLPLVLFSHGLRTARFYYTSQALELASQGYVVVCPDHSYDVEGVAFPGGKLVRGIFENEQRKKAVEATWRSHDGRIRLWAQDLSFLLDQMLRRRIHRAESKDFPFKGRIDKKRIASMGHCFGGQAALEVGMRDKRIRAVIAENAWPPSNEVRKKGLHKPVLMLYAETDTAEEGLLSKGVPKAQIQKLKRVYLADQKKGLLSITDEGIQVRIHGARHMSFSDEFLIRHWMELPDGASPPPPDDHLRLALVYATAFLDRELRGKKPDLLKASTKLEREGVDYEDLSETSRSRARSKKKRRE